MCNNETSSKMKTCNFQKFKIQGDIDPVERERLYWSNSIGWVDFNSAETFEADELYAIHFPCGSDNLRVAWLKKDGSVAVADSLDQAFGRETTYP